VVSVEAKTIAIVLAWNWLFPALRKVDQLGREGITKR
jgi:hypothetical protein